MGIGSGSASFVRNLVGVVRQITNAISWVRYSISLDYWVWGLVGQSSHSVRSGPSGLGNYWHSGISIWTGGWC